MKRFHLARLGGTATAVALTMTLVAAPAPAGPATLEEGTQLAEELIKKVSGPSVQRHLIAFQRITHMNDGNRADQTSGYDASVDYVAGHLRRAGFIVETPEFTYEEEVADATDLTVGDSTFHVDKLAESIDTPTNGVSGPLVVVPEDPAGLTGCVAEDYAGLPADGAI